MSGSTLWKKNQKTSTHLLVWMIKPGSFARQFRCSIFSFQVFSKKQGYIASTASAHQRPAVEGM